MITAKPLARDSAVEGALASDFATAELHLSGRDLPRPYVGRFDEACPGSHLH
ncbi:hypothetical protein [Mesorhizobium sp. 128a]